MSHRMPFTHKKGMYIHYHSISNQTIWGKIFFYKRINTFIQHGCIKLIKSDWKDIYVQMISVSNKCCSFELLIYKRILNYVSVSTNIFVFNW